MNKISACFAFALAAGVSLLGTAAQAGDELTITSWGGAYQESQRKAFFEPYNAAGNKVTEAEYTGEIAKIRAMVESGAVTWDVVDTDTMTVIAGCAEGIFEVLDWAKLGLDRANFIGGDVTDCGVPSIMYSTVVGYDTSKTATPASLFEAIFDTAKFPGKRGLQKSPFVNLEWALMADGVAPEEVYKVLATSEGVDRAFKKLDTIKNDIIWWESGAQSVQLLADGQVAFTSTWNGRIDNAVKVDKRPFKIIWDRQAPDWDWWTIPKGTPKIEEAYRFITFASDPQRMADQTKYIPYGPANKDAAAKVDPAILPDLPSAPENLKTAFYPDPQFWGDKGDELRERFNAWLAQ